MAPRAHPSAPLAVCIQSGGVPEASASGVPNLLTSKMAYPGDAGERLSYAGEGPDYTDKEVVRASFVFFLRIVWGRGRG